MWQSRNRLYRLFFLLCLVGYLWLFFNFSVKDSALQLCFIKNLTGYPCPSCGVTRSVVQLFYGDFIEAIYINPLGLILFILVIILPLWIVVDIVLKKASLWLFYKKAEVWFSQKKVFIPFIVLIILNWIWNFVKGY